MHLLDKLQTIQGSTIRNWGYHSKLNLHTQAMHIVDHHVTQTDNGYVRSSDVRKQYVHQQHLDQPWLHQDLETHLKLSMKWLWEADATCSALWTQRQRRHERMFQSIRL